MHEDEVPIEALLSHREWVRSVARCLVRDDPDDLEQQAWLESIESPPAHASSIKGWFRTVLRRRARDRWRSEDRRDRREEATARPSTSPSTASVVAEAEAHRKVVEAVLTLEEPYRTTLLLRFYEDLPPREVAQRMGVPVETVRTRTRRALDRMRERLGGERRREEWLAALMPLLPARGEPAGIGAGVAGGAVMASKTTVAVAVGVAALGIVLAASATGVFEGSGKEPAATARVRPERPLPAEPPPPPEVTKATASAIAPPPDASAAPPADATHLAAQQRKIAELEAMLEAMKAKEAAKDAAPPAAVDLASLTTEQLLAEIRKTMRPRSIGEPFDAAGLLERCALLLARELPTDSRCEVLLAKGVGHRVQQNPVSEEAAFREVLTLVGPATPRGREARTQLAWTAANADPRGGAEAFLSLAAESDAPASQRAWNRYYGAMHMEKAGDSARARTEYGALVDEFGSSTDQGTKMVVDMARKAIDRGKE